MDARLEKAISHVRSWPDAALRRRAPGGRHRRPPRAVSLPRLPAQSRRVQLQLAQPRRQFRRRPGAGKLAVAQQGVVALVSVRDDSLPLGCRAVESWPHRSSEVLFCAESRSGRREAEEGGGGCEQHLPRSGSGPETEEMDYGCRNRCVCCLAGLFF
jgi:hypothetical protein